MDQDVGYLSLTKKKVPFPKSNLLVVWLGSYRRCQNVDGIPWNDVFRASFVAKGKRTYDGGGEKTI